MNRYSNKPCSKCGSGVQVKDRPGGLLCESCWYKTIKNDPISAIDLEKEEVALKCRHIWKVRTTDLVKVDNEISRTVITEIYCSMCLEVEELYSKKKT